MLRLAFMVVSIVLVVGCKSDNLQSCDRAENADKPDCMDAGTGGPCKSSTDCMDPSLPACDTADNGGTCVQCTANDPAACNGVTPICNIHTCVACINNDDCGQDALCLPNGACATSGNIIHAVSSGGIDVTGCGGTGLGNACKLERALTEVNATKNVIKLDDAGPYTPGSNSFTVNNNVTIDARGATLHHNGDNPILSITGSKTATIFGGTIEDAAGSNNSDGVLCSSGASITIDGTTLQRSDRSAINATNGCHLTVTNATISNNSKRSSVFVAAILANGASVTLSRSRLLSNTGGGINVSNGTFEIVGNVFYDNGDTMSPTGGVSTSVGPDTMNRIEFNSFSGNHTVPGKAPGVDCTAGTGTIARNNIIWGNNDNLGPQIGGGCKHAYSDIQLLNLVPSIDGGNNLSVNPMFKSMSDLHLMPESMAVKMADPSAKLDGIAAKDIDSEPRITPADIGADQLPR